MIRVHLRGFLGIPALPEKVYNVLGSVLSMASRDLTNGNWSGSELIIDEVDGPTSIEIEFMNGRKETDTGPLVARIKALFDQRFSFAIPVDIHPMIATP